MAIPATRIPRAASRPARVPAKARPARPHLEVVRDGRLAPATRRRRARALAVVASLVVAAALFGLVAANVLLTQNQFALDAIETKAAAEEARYERLRLEVAELEAPGRVVAAAQERLGMVPPPSVSYLSPTGPSSSTAPESGPTPHTWAKVKPHLSGRP